MIVNQFIAMLFFSNDIKNKKPNENAGTLIIRQIFFREHFFREFTEILHIYNRNNLL